MSWYFGALFLLSAAFFVGWEHLEHPLLIFLYVFTMLGVTLGFVFSERRRIGGLLARFEHILDTGGRDSLMEEGLTPPERKLISRLCELETREEKVRRGYRNISSLVSDIAHQSKTPLASILMYTEMNEETQIIRAQTEKLSFLMESLTKLAKCEGGLIAENLAPKENSVRELVRNVVEAYYSAADGKEMELRCDIPAGLSAVFDLRWTGEAVGNLLDNAIKYSPNGSTIRISARAYDLFVRLDLADEGQGISEEDLCNIWKRFYRGKNTESQSGVGIGLYLTEQILHTEGGRCAAISSEGGSTFSVFLPRA